MAQRAKRDPFGPFVNGFNFDQAFDGDVWTLNKDEDFTLAPSTIAMRLREEYERRYGSLELKVDGDSVHVRRVVPTAHP